MAAHSGCNITNDGLLIHVDPQSAERFIPNTSTNLLINGEFANGENMPQANVAGSNPSNNIIELDNPGVNNWVLQQEMGTASTEYEITFVTSVKPSSTYVMSGWYAQSVDYVGESRMFHARIYSSSGAHISTGVGIGYQIGDSVTIDGIEWSYRFYTINSPADPSSTVIWYVGYASGTYSGKRYYTDLRMEEGTVPSLVDLSNNNNDIVMKNFPATAIDNEGYTFDGSNDYGIISNVNMSGSWTVSAWVKLSTLTNYTHILTSFANQGQFACKIGSSGGGAKPYFYSTTGRTFNNGPTVLSVNKWYHIVYSYDGAKFRIYVDGVLEETVNDSSVSIGTYDMKINGGNNEFNNFKMGNLAVYSRALTNQEVNLNYLAHRTRFI